MHANELITSRRIKREKETVEKMISLYCHDHHHTSVGLCDDCCKLLDYALFRINRCPFAPDKPACSQCSVHCYLPQMREKIRVVMRYAGPRMLLNHPVLALFHLYVVLFKKSQMHSVRE